MKPKVTVIMPSLNVAEYIEESILSVFGQTLKGIEILCIDAGSTDGTWEILQKYAGNSAKDMSVRVLRSDRKSYGYQVNRGIKAAKGDYIAILETDDYVDADMYRLLYETAIRQDADVVKADYDLFRTLKSGKRYFERIMLWADHREKYNRVICPQKEVYLYANDYNIWKGIYKKEFLTWHQIKLNESPGAAYQDIGFSEQVLACAQRAYYTDASCYRYRMDRETSSVNSGQGLQYACQEFSRLLDSPALYQKLVCKEGLYYHMAQAFFGEYRKTLEAVNYDTEAENLSLYYDWFYDHLVEAWKTGSLPVEQMGAGLAAQLKLLLSDKELFCQKEKAVKDREQAFIGKIRQSAAKNEDPNIYIFGAGQYGKWAIDFLRKNDMEPEGICDNKESLWGTCVDGFPVIPPAQCAENFRSRGGVFLIANKMHGQDIRRQLLEMGVCERQILFCSPL